MEHTDLETFQSTENMIRSRNPTQDVPLPRSVEDAIAREAIWEDVEHLNPTCNTFVRKVFQAAIDLHAERPELPMRVLFDVDGTIQDLLKDEPETNDGTSTYGAVRPGFPSLMKLLRQTPFFHGIRVGYITQHQVYDHRTGGPSAEAYALLGEHADMLDPELAISSRNGQFPELEEIENENDFPAMLTAAKSVISPKAVTELEAAGTLEGSDWTDTKVAIISRIIGEYTNYAFVIVDDINHAGLLEHERVRGVHLTDGDGRYNSLYD